jgi:hypothetical protein
MRRLGLRLRLGLMALLVLLPLLVGGLLLISQAYSPQQGVSLGMILSLLGLFAVCYLSLTVYQSVIGTADALTRRVHSEAEAVTQAMDVALRTHPLPWIGCAKKAPPKRSAAHYLWDVFFGTRLPMPAATG